MIRKNGYSQRLCARATSQYCTNKNNDINIVFSPPEAKLQAALSEESGGGSTTSGVSGVSAVSAVSGASGACARYWAAAKLPHLPAPS